MTALPYGRIAEEPASRSSLFAVAFSFVFTLAPHVAHLPLWVSLFSLFAVGWRVAQEAGRVPVLPRWLLVPLVLLGGMGVFAQYWTITGRDPGLALLTVMASFKFLESKTHRDILILIFLCYFLLATHFLFGQSMGIALYMLLALAVITSALIAINQRDDSLPWSNRLKLAGRMIALALPIMALLFLLVPRIPGPLWGLTKEQRGGITGLSERMRPGDISSLIQSNEVAFRVDFDGPIPPQGKLYWRGPVMVRYNGREWTQARHFALRQLDVEALGEPVSYTMTMEAHGKNWLLGLDIPVSIPQKPESYLSSEYQLTAEHAVNDLSRYPVRSLLDYRLGLNESFDYLLLASQFPNNRNPRTIELGRRWAREYDDPWQIVQRGLQLFREQPFIYTLNPPLLGEDASDDFLFRTRQGFCENYAGSYALLMRAAGIPARIVTGYQGGEINEVGNYLIVRQSDAHAWVEVWLEGRGWVRIDPTAAVSPDRIEGGLDQALSGAEALFRIGRRNPVLSRLLFRWDSLQYGWNKWILQYNQDRQMSLMRRLGLGIKSWGDLILTLVLSLGLLVALYIAIALWRGRPKPRSPEQKALDRLLARLARAGYPRRPSEDLRSYLHRLQKAGIADEELRSLLEAFQRMRYAARPPKQQIGQLLQRARRWRPH
jgi:transglutaminase-like putative cysteine protease